MFHYSGYGLCIHSEVEMPDLPPGHEHPDVTIRLGPVPRTPARATMSEEIAHHARGGSFHITGGREIVIEPLPGADPALLQVLLMGRVMGFLLRQRGWLPLHASAVEVEGQAVLFLGASGSGKSTTAAAFHARGHRVITDDVAAVRVKKGSQCLIQPAWGRIRLLRDSQAVLNGAELKNGIELEGVLQWRKHSFDLARGEISRLYPVHRIYVLEYGESITCERMPALLAFSELSTHCFVKRGCMDTVALAAHLRDSAAVAGAVAVFRLSRPRSLDALPELIRWLEKDLARDIH